MVAGSRSEQSIYGRVLLKISGESLQGLGPETINPEAVAYIADQVIDAQTRGVEIAVVVGGGNIWRGTTAERQGMDRSAADYAGMVATIINGLALQDALERRGVTYQDPIGACQYRRSQSHTSAAVQCGTWKRDVWSCSVPDPGTHTCQLTPLRPCVPWKSGQTCCLMAKNGVDGVYDSDPRTQPGGSAIRQS